MSKEGSDGMWKRKALLEKGTTRERYYQEKDTKGRHYSRKTLREGARDRHEKEGTAR